MVTKTLQIAVRTILSNHLYQMDGKVYRQQEGGPIGLVWSFGKVSHVVVGQGVYEKGQGI